MQTVIKVEQLSKAYNGQPVLDRLCISVQAGTVFGLLGADGAGKTTAIECILGVKSADGGKVFLLGHHPQKERRQLFQKVGVQFQQGDFQPEICLAELCEETACLYEAPADWQKLCAQFGLADKLKQTIKSLSGGERQKLFIVLALIPNPRLVFLDELTTGLDAKARREVWQILAKLKSNGLTIFLTSHFMDEVEVLCDEICILHKGQAVFYGTVEQAKQACNCTKFEEAYLALSGEEAAI